MQGNRIKSLVAFWERIESPDCSFGQRIFHKRGSVLADVWYERVGRKVLTIERSTQKKLVQDGQRSKQFTLQMYEKQRV